MLDPEEVELLPAENESKLPTGPENTNKPMSSFVLTNGYEELVRSLASDENTSFNNIHMTSRVGITRVSLGGAFIGIILGFHLCLFFFALKSGSTATLQWCLYVFGLCCFHYLEFLTTAAFKPRDVNYESYLLHHSTSYIIAAVASWAEFWAEIYLFPSIKGRYLLVIPAFVMLVIFQGIRTTAMTTAGRNFNHLVQVEAQSDGHDLVTHGVYKYLRHPSYFGWFWWSIATQVLLANPLCLCAYAYASWKFFDARVYHEERSLYHDIFPNKYGQYCKTAKIAIPFITGYVDTLQE
jgi:protein-S-isoprenylcysteine O-methyltransferase